MIDELIKLVKEGFKSIKDHRGYNSTYSLPDLLSAGFAIFSLKDPSLLAFREQFPQRSENLKRIYGIERIPEDTALREGLDGIDPALLQAQFKPMIENETFNTLKNQGYYLEHNYGHGKKYLATNFAIRTFLAFLIDQMAQCLDNSFQKALAVYQTKRAFWEKVRQVFDLLPAVSMNAIYRFIAKNKQLDFPLLE